MSAMIAVFPVTSAQLSVRKLINDLSLNRNEEACGNQVYVISSGRE
jgi:hypothetical protein